MLIIALLAGLALIAFAIRREMTRQDSSSEISALVEKRDYWLCRALNCEPDCDHHTMACRCLRQLTTQLDRLGYAG